MTIAKQPEYVSRLLAEKAEWERKSFDAGRRDGERWVQQRATFQQLLNLDCDLPCEFYERSLFMRQNGEMPPTGCMFWEDQASISLNTVSASHYIEGWVDSAIAASDYPDLGEFHASVTPHR